MADLYIPPGAPRPEPVAKLTYGEYEFEIGYTLMHWITNWLAHGMFEAHSVPTAAKANTRAAFDRVRSEMMLYSLRENGIRDLEELRPFVLPYPQTPVPEASASAGKQCNCSNTEGEICHVCDPSDGRGRCSDSQIDEWESFARWTKRQGGYSLISAEYADVLETDGGTPLPTFLQDATEHAWRGWVHGRAAKQAAVLQSTTLCSCPFCGEEDSFVELADNTASFVQCNSCGARGPVEVQDSDDETIPGHDAAMRAWNKRA